MRVWIISDRKHGDSSDDRWLCDWMENPPVDEHGDSDHDMAKVHISKHASRDDAMARAKQDAKHPNIWGPVAVYRQYLEQVEGDVYDWQSYGDAEYVE